MSARCSIGIEVLVRKAAVDPAFKARLLAERAAAAGEIGLELDPAEAMLLAAAPAGQLEAIIGRTTVPQEHRLASLGQAAAAMLAALGTMTPASASAGGMAFKGGWGSGGMRMDNPGENKAEPVETQVIEIVAKQFNLGKEQVKRDTSFVKDLGASVADLAEVRHQLENQFGLTIPVAAFKNARTVGAVIDYVEKAVDLKKRRAVAPPTPAAPRGFVDPQGASGGTRPDRPPPLINRPDPITEAQELRRRYMRNRP